MGIKTKTPPRQAERDPDSPSGHDTAAKPTIAIVIHPETRRQSGAGRVNERAPEARLAEAVGLAETIGLEIGLAEVVRVPKMRAATLLGPGTIERLQAVVAELGADLLVMDCALGPAQQRNLEKALKVKVIDRTGLILEIFGARARTHEGRLQVELAALTYQRSRLVRSWTHLERQRGGLGKTGGPGESQLEIDRRLTDERIARLKKQLEQVKRTRGLHRAARADVPYPVVALVGYTNAGKSTLFNRLAHADVMAEDKLFATLDPTMRRIALPGGRDVILSDTVGFIADLPTQLVAAFRATLEEVQAADLILHVRDVASPDTEAQRRDVDAVLADLGVGDTPRLVVLNKIDRLSPEERASFVSEQPADGGLQDGGLEDGVLADGGPAESMVAISALTGEGTEALTARIAETLVAHRDLVTFTVPVQRGDALAWLHRHAQVEQVDAHDDVLECTVRIGQSESMRFASRFAIPPRVGAAA